MRVSSETPATIRDRFALIRALELKLELLEHGLGMPRDEDAIARTKALLKEAERAGWQALNERFPGLSPLST
jgi:hypothetical protein